MRISSYLTDEQKEELYLEFFNDYLTIEKFAEHHGLSFAGAQDIINEGKAINWRESAVIAAIV